MKEVQTKIKSLTGLRALALWAVMLYHFFPNKVQGGYLGVVVFFVLSGYLLMYKEVQRPEKNPWKKFLKRYKRLTPPLLVMVSSVSLFVALFYRKDLPSLIGPGISALFGLNNLYQISHGLSYFDLHGSLRPFTHLWAQSAQIQFYLIWALFISLSPKNLSKRISYLGIAGIVSFVLMLILYPFSKEASSIYYGTHTRFFSFSVGSFFALMASRGAGKGSQKNKGGLAAILIGLLLLSFVFYKEGPSLYYGGMGLISLLVGRILVLISKEDNKVAKLLSHPLLLFFGERAYSYYLWQYALMLIFQQIFSHSTLSYFFQVLLQLILLLLLGEYSYRKWEKTNRKKSHLLIFLLLYIGLISFSIFLTKEGAKQEDIKEAAPSSQRIEDPALENNTLKQEDLGLSQKIREHLAQIPGLMIGDSITEGAQDTLKEIFPKFAIDGKINRQMVHALELLDQGLMDNLPPEAPIVLQLGTNSDFNTQTLEKVIEKTSPHPVFLVNTAMPDPWESSVNAKLENIAQNNARVYLVDWYSRAKTRPQLFTQDHTHPNIEGQKLLCQLIGQSILQEESSYKGKEGQ